MKRIFVFPCGSEIGLEIHKSLHVSTHFRLFGGSSVDDHGKFVYANYIDNIPHVDDPVFIEKLNEIIIAHQVDYIFPAHDSVVLRLAQAHAEGQLQCDVITSPVTTCEIARSKKRSYEQFQDVIPTPKVYASANKIAPEDFPVFLKPDVGQGSKGTQIAGSQEDIAFYVSKDPTLLLLEYLPGKEYTVDCFTDKNGQLRFAEGRERMRIANGISVQSESVNDEKFTEIAATINKTLKFRGVWFFQLKERKNGELVLMEIAPRVAGTMGLVRCKGVNLPLLSLFDHIGYDVEVFENNGKMVIDRALQNSYQHDLQYAHVYLDFDDLVIFKGKVNPAVMAFVYQCMNKNISVHLLTRHQADLEASLKKYRLTGVFDEVIWLKNGEPKHHSITKKGAIFIDDSFAERQAVHQALRIPVFDAHMIESLMEKF